MNIMLYKLIEQVAILYPALIILFTLCGATKATAAYMMGDDNPYDFGFVSLNPLQHIDPMGLLILVGVLSLFQFDGFASVLAVTAWVFALFSGVQPYFRVPIDPHGRNFRSRRLGLFVTAIAGISSYFILWRLCAVVVLIAAIKATPLWIAIGRIFNTLAGWTLVFGIISLIPVPPLEASMLWPALFGESGDEIYAWLEERSLFILLGLLVVFILWSRGA